MKIIYSWFIGTLGYFVSRSTTPNDWGILSQLTVLPSNGQHCQPWGYRWLLLLTEQCNLTFSSRRAVRNGQLKREQRKHQGAEDPDPLHNVAALSDRTALSWMWQGINARLDRVAMLLRPLRRIASSLQTHHLLLLCPFLLLPQLHLRPPAPLGAHRALPSDGKRISSSV